MVLILLLLISLVGSCKGCEAVLGRVELLIEELREFKREAAIDITVVKEAVDKVQVAVTKISAPSSIEV